MRYLLLFLAFSSFSAAAQQVTDALVEEYKRGISQGCKAQAKRQNSDSNRSERVCSCIASVLDRELSRDEWRQLTELSMHNKQEEQGRLMSKHAQKTFYCHKTS